MNQILAKCKQGDTYKVSRINGNKETLQFLNNIGLTIGDTIIIISKISSIFIINIKDGRFGVDKRIANLIEVESCTE